MRGDRDRRNAIGVQVPEPWAIRTIVWYWSRACCIPARAIGDEDGLRQVRRVDDDQLRTRGRGERDDEESGSNEVRMMRLLLECGTAFGPARTPGSSRSLVR